MHNTSHEIPAGPLLKHSWLVPRLDDSRVRVVDTRGRIPPPGATPQSRRADFDAGHIPGATFVQWYEDFIDTADDVANQLSPPDRFADAATRHGIGNDSIVVAYDDYHSIFAARLWWAFRAMGHERVFVLDGGWNGWLGAGLPVSTQQQSATTRPQARFVARPRPELRWNIEDVAGRSDDVVLVDARSRERFAGAGGDPVPGHIPGSVNAPYAELVGADGFLRPPTELERVLRAAGIDPQHPPRQLVATCGSGISAAVPLLALEVLVPGTGCRGAVYDGSWGEWSRSGQPVALGAACGP